MRNVLFLTMVALVAVGCGSTTPRDSWVYVKPGVSEAQRRQDEQACLMRSVGVADIKQLPLAGQMLNREAYNECMSGRGYDVRLVALGG